MKNIIFFLDSYTDKKGEKLLYVKQGKYKVRTPIKLDPKLWNKSKQSVLKNHPLWFEINTNLQNLVQFVNKKQLEKPGYSFITAVKEFYNKVTGDKDNTLSHILQTALELKKPLISKSRYFTYTWLIKEIEGLPINDTKIANFGANELNYYINFLIEKNNTNNTIDGKLRRLHALLATYSKNIVKLDLSFFEKVVKPRGYEADLIALTEDELNSIVNLELTGTKENVRDTFVFACYTGARFSDINSLVFSRDIKENFWHLRVTKTHDILYIPLLAKANELINKYKTQDKFPIITNQKTNDYLKEIGKEAGIDKLIKTTKYHGGNSSTASIPKWQLLSFHSARRTFITIGLTKGIQAQVIMKITGHKNYNTFKKYIKFSNQQVAKEFLEKWETR